MQQILHPAYTPLHAVCSCGNAFNTRSTLACDKIDLDICDKCHPFYTGKQKDVGNTAGRVAQFKERYGFKSPTK